MALPYTEIIAVIFESMADDLIAFLNARLDETERLALAASPWPYDSVDSASTIPGASPLFVWAHVTTHDPDRALREVAFKRKIVEWHNAQCTCAWVTADGDDLDDLDEPDFAPACPTLCFLAAIYSGHPDYRQEWAA